MKKQESEKAAKAAVRLEQADGEEFPMAEYRHRQALIEATLAVAYEQRTANMLAWLGRAEDPPMVRAELVQAIHERLGL